ncbi:vacuolar protein sorting-associated protein 54 [Ditylenchus destructor]|nr:vacuolar protein sorting-associated protein 54 [Ditylenchus destructor]
MKSKSPSTIDDHRNFCKPIHSVLAANNLTDFPSSSNSPAQRCVLCRVTFTSDRQFIAHLRSDHCSKEGGSFVCRFGPNGVCQSLPLEGVSDDDYEKHVLKFHLHRNEDWFNEKHHDLRKMSTTSFTVNRSVAFAK